jgi:PAS domain S-box-containing protein
MAKTSDMRKTKAELVEDLQKLRRQVAKLRKQVDEYKQAEGKPAREQILLQALLDNLPDHIYFKDTGSRFISISRSQAERFDLEDLAQAVGKTDFDFFTEDHARPAYEDEQRIIKTGEPILGIEERETWPDRPDTWVMTSKMPLRDEAGNIVGTFGISSDITERKRAEEALQRRAVQLQTAAEVSRAASSILDLDKLIQTVVDLIRERFDLYYSGLFLVDEAGRWAVLRAGTGEAGQKMLKQGHKLEVGGSSMIGWCVANKQARIALDVGEEAVRFENPHLPETRSELALPLVSRGEAIGALTIQSTQEAAFSDEDIAVLQTMADQLANAIANARLYDALAQEQYLMKALMDNVPDYIYFKDRESRFIRTTKAHAKTFGLSDPAEAIGKTDFDFFSEEHARGAYEDEQRIIRTGEPTLGIEERETWPDRPDTWVMTSKMPLRDEAGNIVGAFGISSDITERKRLEEALQRRATQLQAAAEVAREATSILDVRQLLDRTVSLISNRFGFYHAGIFLVDEQGKYAILRAASSEGGRRMLERGHRLEVGEIGIVGYVTGTGEPRIALDVGEDAVYFDNPNLPHTRSEMALPLRVRGRVIGALDVQSVEPAAFTEVDATVLQTMADQLAFAIENARLIERTEAQLRELSRVYGEYSTAAWAELASPERSLAYVYDRIDVLPAEELPAFEMALERSETVTVADLEAGSVLAVPLKVHGQVIGTIGVQETGDAREWSPQEIAFAEAIGEQVAQALDGARLFAETQRSAQQTRALYETGRALSSSLEEKSLMRATLEAMYRTLDCDHAIISIADEEMQTIGVRHSIWHGEFDAFPEWVEMARHPLDQPSVLTDVYRTGRTEIIDGWDERLDREIYEKFGHERLLRVFAPIRIRDRTLGIVEVGYDKRKKDHLDESEMQMLSAFMDQAATALENVRLFEQAQRRAERERQIYEITARLRRSPDVAAILKAAVDELGQALQADRAVIRMRVKPREEQRDAEKAVETSVESPEG